MITTDNAEMAERMRLFRTHGITRDPKQFAPSKEVSASSTPSSLPPACPVEFTEGDSAAYSSGAPCALPFYYEMVDLGYNYRMTDFQCALGISQLRKLPEFLKRRREITARYDEAFANLSGINPLAVSPNVLHAYHLYVIRIASNILGIDRTTLFTKLHEKGIGVNVHYIPVHLHPFYREKFHTDPGLCPMAEAAYEQIISIPMFLGMTDEDVENVINVMQKTVLQNQDK